MENPQDFVTTTSILTFGGASVAVLVVSTAVQRVLTKNWIVIPFATAMVVGFTVAGASAKLSSPLEWLIAFVNSCLLFCTATGANELAAERPAGGTRPQGRPRGRWFVSWFA
jgi:hypothetical protein